jgi:pimeloyl-ACP methyl ester carboxylesterase
MLVLAGEKAFGNFLIEQGRLVASNVNDIIQGSGHWLMEEAPQQTIPALVNFINGPM